MARHGSDTTGRVVLRHSLNFHNFLVRKADSDAASACASAVVVKSRAVAPSQEHSMSMSFALVDSGLSPSYWAISISLGCLLPQVRVILIRLFMKMMGSRTDSSHSRVVCIASPALVMRLDDSADMIFRLPLLLSM